MRGSGRTIVEHCLILDLYSMLRTGILVRGSVKNGSVHWKRSGSMMHYQALLKEDGTGGIRLMFTRRDDAGDWQPRECWVMMRATPQPFGGRRWWFVCPISGRHVAKVYMPGWSSRFASQAALGLDYACQREGARDRSTRRAHKLREELGLENGIGDAIVKPKWMRWQTFARKEAAIRAADARTLAGFAQYLGRIDERLRRSYAAASKRG